jgi:hypothetical protein
MMRCVGAPPRTEIADRIATGLAPYLGHHTSRNAVKHFTQKALGRGPETLTVDDLPQLIDALRPMLRTFVGRAKAEILLERVLKWGGA